MTERMTRAEVERYVELVKSAAEREGLTDIAYGGHVKFADLYLQGAYGTYRLTTGNADVGSARGLREVHTFLQGIYAGIDAIRHSRVERDSR